MAELTDIRETVRERYAAAAKAAADAQSQAGCCGPELLRCSPADQAGVFGGTLYDHESREDVPEAAISASLGCGVPTAVADLRPGEIVLDLGSGAGADVLISARRVAPTGKAIGLDMTDEMSSSHAPTPNRPALRTSSSSRATSRTCPSPTRASMSSSPTS